MLLLCCLLVGGSAWADDVTIGTGTFDGKNSTYTTGWSTTGTGNKRTDCIVIGKGENITSPAFDLSGYSKVTISIKARRYGTLAGSKATIDASIAGSSVGTTDANGTSATTSLADIEFTPTSSMTAATIIFTCTNATKEGSSHGAGVNTITITGTPKSAAGQVATPSITGNDGDFVTSKTITITTTTEGASIYYTLDGTAPTTSSTPYSDPFNITETTTVRALAVKDGLTDSDIASKTFTKLLKENIAAFVAGGVTGYIQLTDALVTYKNGTSAYIEDASGAILLYQCAGDLEAGDKINGIMNVTNYTVYNNLPEIKNFSLLDGYTKTSGNTVTPTEVTLATLLADYNSYLSRYVVIKGATVTSAFDSKNCTIQQGVDEIALRDQNSDPTLTSTLGANINVTAHVAIYSTTKQIAVYEQSQIEEYAPISISDAGLATFASDFDLDFTSVEGVEAYIAKENVSKIELTKVNKVPAGTGVLLRSTAGGAVAKDVPVAASTDDVTGNVFVRGTGSAVETGTGPYNYVLGKKSGVVGFYKANGATVTSDKAYLQTTLGSAARIDINFDDATAIEAVKAQNVENGQFFNLAGQRVAQPTKGLYIVNGKKVIIK
jgi:hypothetical protein